MAIQARHSEWSVISSADDLYLQPTEALVDLLISAAARAQRIDLADIGGRFERTDDARLVNQWPGEHYRLLPALAETINARVAIEIGTFLGTGALALRQGLPAHGRVVTYDIVPWQEIPGAILRGADFNEHFEQRIGDLSDPAYLATQLDSLLEADILFVDGPKNGNFETTFAREVLPQLTDRPRLVVFDDIRVMNMLQLWRDLPFAKLDATTLGHWSGTGLLLTA